MGKNGRAVSDEESQQPAEQTPEETEEGPPIPDPERENGGDGEDVPTAD
jgi:hypothetical protein